MAQNDEYEDDDEEYEDDDEEYEDEEDEIEDKKKRSNKGKTNKKINIRNSYGSFISSCRICICILGLQ